jgi:hypothetical protein
MHDMRKKTHTHTHERERRGDSLHIFGLPGILGSSLPISYTYPYLESRIRRGNSFLICVVDVERVGHHVCLHDCTHFFCRV